MAEQRKTKRIFTRVPLRVRGSDELDQAFSEDTTTLEINRDGARVALRNVPRLGARLEITNLSRNLTASLRVTHRCLQSYSGLPEWGLEFFEPVPDFWGIAFEESDPKQELVVSALIACERCARKEMVNLSSDEYRQLGQQYFLSRSCSACGMATQWEVVSRDEEEPAALLEIPSGGAGPGVKEERRLIRRLTLNPPMLVTASDGAQELLEAQDFSKYGLRFKSSLELQAGEEIQVSIGHRVAKVPLVKRCLVIWRRPREKSGQYLYGVKFRDRE